MSRVDLFRQLWTLVCILFCFSATVSAQDQATQHMASTAPAPRLTVVTANANVRAQPSRQGTILSVAKAGTIVQTLSSSGSWERVKTERGTVGWIHTSLLVQLQKPSLFQTAPAPASLPQQRLDEQQAVSGTEQSISASPPVPDEPLIFPEANVPTASLEDLDTSAPADEVARGTSESGTSESDTSENADTAAYRSTDEDDTAGLFGGSRLLYVLAALLVGVLGLLVFQIRRTREIEQRIDMFAQTAPKDAQENSQEDSQEDASDIQPVEPLEPQSRRPEFSSFRLDHPDQPGEASPQHTSSPLPPLPDVPVEFSPPERVVLETIFSHEEVPEPELKAILDKRGFPGMLLKAVVGDIMRKTGSDGIPWIRVRYTQGVFSYQLQHLPKRSHGLAGPSYLNGQEHSNT